MQAPRTLLVAIATALLLACGDRDAAVLGTQSVGYGIVDSGHALVGLGSGTRRFASVRFDSLTPDLLHTRNAPAADLGGTCFGDSGGPYLFEGTTELAAIMTSVNPVCQATAWAQRLDRQEVHDFLGPLLAAD